MNREQTASIIAFLCAAFPQVPVSRETVEVYHGALADLDPEAAKSAVREILLTAERFPPPAVIRRKIAEQAGLLAPTPIDAWGEVMRQVTLMGVRGMPSFSHPAITQVVDSLSWWNICMSENADTLRAHFLKQYDLLRTQADTRTIADALQGLPAPRRPELEARTA